MRMLGLPIKLLKISVDITAFSQKVNRHTKDDRTLKWSDKDLKGLTIKLLRKRDVKP